MSLPEICALDVTSIAAPDCFLAMWWADPIAPEALEVVKALGLHAQEHDELHLAQDDEARKSHFEMGHSTRANAENCLLAMRGNPKRVNADVSQFIDAPWTKHSAKPNEVRERLVRLMGDVPRIELFAREATAGWDVWGNEVESTMKVPLKAPISEGSSGTIHTSAPPTPTHEERRNVTLDGA